MSNSLSCPLFEARSTTWHFLRNGLEELSDYFDFSLPTHASSYSPDNGFSWDSSDCRVQCSWFGFNIRVKPSAPFSRTDLVRFLDSRKIGNRMLFGGNLLRQPAFVNFKRDNPHGLRVVGDLDGADSIMNTSLFLGTYPGLTSEMLDYEIQSIKDFVRKYS